MRGSSRVEVKRHETKRILYVQYTNPGGYPPLQHSSRILADNGWTVWFLGTESVGSKVLHFPPHTRIHVTQLAIPLSGVLGKFSYLVFCFCVLCATIGWRPDWIYASDLLSYPSSYLASIVTRRRVILHEHDSPGPQSGVLGRVLLWVRAPLARKARLCVIPNETRAQAFRWQTGAKAVTVVWFA